MTKYWLTGKERQIAIFYLLSYSPEFNPDEYFKCDLKARMHSGNPAHSKEQLKRKVIHRIMEALTQTLGPDGNVVGRYRQKPFMVFSNHQNPAQPTAMLTSE